MKKLLISVITGLTLFTATASGEDAIGERLLNAINPPKRCDFIHQQDDTMQMFPRTAFRKTNQEKTAFLIAGWEPGGEKEKGVVILSRLVEPQDKAPDSCAAIEVLYDLERGRIGAAGFTRCASGELHEATTIGEDFNTGKPVGEDRRPFWDAKILEIIVEAEATQSKCQ